MCENFLSDFDVISNWLKTNLLTINLNKTLYTVISLSNIPDGIKVTIIDTELNYSQEFLFLGILIDNKLTFKDHIKEISRKIVKSVGLIQKM